jgi:uncharacterized membrane protein
MAISHVFASWHPALVHFPIALLFVAFFLELAAFIRNDRTVGWAGTCLLVCGTLGLMVTFITGQYAQIVAARSLIPQDPINVHEAYAIATSWGFVGILTWRSYLNVENRGMHRVYLIAFFLGLVMLLLTGYLGGQLVYKFAAGVQGVHPPFAPTPKDLSNLTLVETPPELAYSDMMHHVFGYMTLFLAVWLGYQHFDLPGQDKILSLGPIALFGGGIFLAIFSDWDAWPLDSIKPITDPEVLFHKVIATIMIFFGIGMNLARRRPNCIEVAKMQSHLIALLALIGGGMLFTHVHTGAPYSDTAIGVYVQHFVIGVIALTCGGVKMLELIRPERRRLWNLIWIVLLLFAGFNLVTYREGFPWYAPSDQVPFWSGNQG